MGMEFREGTEGKVHSVLSGASSWKDFQGRMCLHGWGCLCGSGQGSSQVHLLASLAYGLEGLEDHILRQVCGLSMQRDFLTTWLLLKSQISYMAAEGSQHILQSTRQKLNCLLLTHPQKSCSPTSLIFFFFNPVT